LEWVEEPVLLKKEKLKKNNMARYAKPMAKDVTKMKKGSATKKAFKPHMMYDPKTGKGYKAKVMADHTRMKKKGYTHTKPKKKK